MLFYRHFCHHGRCAWVQERSKPVEPPTKPAAAPFFLPTIPGLEGNPVFDTDAGEAPGCSPSNPPHVMHACTHPTLFSMTTNSPSFFMYLQLKISTTSRCREMSPKKQLGDMRCFWLLWFGSNLSTTGKICPGHCTDIVLGIQWRRGWQKGGQQGTYPSWRGC